VNITAALARGLPRAISLAVGSRLGRHRSWPSVAVLIDEPLALAEQATSRLRRIYEKCSAHVWDGPTVFREAVVRHGGIQLSPEKRAALVHPMSMLMWGELAAWVVSAELAERLEDPDARMAASSQVFDEARHFYTLRDYVALLHVPVPQLDPLFATAARSLLDSRDLTLKLLAMQILVEGAAQAMFKFLSDSQVEPVLADILPYIERDEARHVGLGILHLPQRLAQLSPRQCHRVADRVCGIGDLLGLAQIRAVEHYRTLGLDPRELFRQADGMLTSLAAKLGTIPGTSDPYLRTDNPADPDYARKLDLVLPLPGCRPSAVTHLLRRVADLGARALAA